MPELSPTLPILQFQPLDLPGGVLFGGEGALELNDIELPLKDTVAEGDLGTEKWRREERLGCSTGDPTRSAEFEKKEGHFEGTERLPLSLKPH